jgi:hypothetical protein
MKEPLKIPSLSIAELSKAFLGAQIAARTFSEALSKAFLGAQIAARTFSEALSQGTLVEEMQRHLENERWRNDPLQLKKRFLDPAPAFVAGRLRAIADKLDPAPARGKNCGSTYIPRIK